MSASRGGFVRNVFDKYLACLVSLLRYARKCISLSGTDVLCLNSGQFGRTGIPGLKEFEVTRYTIVDKRQLVEARGAPSASFQEGRLVLLNLKKLFYRATMVGMGMRAYEYQVFDALLSDPFDQGDSVDFDFVPVVGVSQIYDICRLCSPVDGDAGLPGIAKWQVAKVLRCRSDNRCEDDEYNSQTLEVEPYELFPTSVAVPYVVILDHRGVPSQAQLHSCPGDRVAFSRQ